MTYYIDSFGKGGSTSSGNWHINFHYIRTDYQGRPYTAHETTNNFRKRDMLEWLAKMQASHNVIMPA
jgi:hypothetical protein